MTTLIALSSAQAYDLVGVALGLVFLVLGRLVLRFNRGVARQTAEWNKQAYDRRVTLLNLDRAERLRRLHEAGPVDRLNAFLLGLALLVAGVACIATAFS